MKIEIQNLGPIHHFEFDLEKDLHLLYGENNVGKSFAVNVVYCVLKVLFNNRQIPLKDYVLNTEVEESITEAILTNKITKFWEEIVVPELNLSIKNTYDSLLPLDFESQKGQNYILIRTNEYSINLAANDNQQFDVREVYIGEKFKNTTLLEETKGTFQHIILPFFFATKITHFVERIYLLPASKSGLYPPLSGMGQILAELSQLRNKLNSKIELPALSEPVSDYYLNIINVDSSANYESPIFSLGEKLETKIIEGRISLDKKSKRIYYASSKANRAINISQTASMISELAPIILFLKYIIPLNGKKNSLLIIEEPEAHLHPKVQVQLMEIFAELTKHNVKVILTSHSNYMFNKLSNMLLKKEIAPEKVGVYHMVMTDKGSEVATDMQATEEGIEDHNFVGVAQQLYQERLETYDLLNEDLDADK